MLDMRLKIEFWFEKLVPAATLLAVLIPHVMAEDSSKPPDASPYFQLHAMRNDVLPATAPTLLRGHAVRNYLYGQAEMQPKGSPLTAVQHRFRTDLSILKPVSVPNLDRILEAQLIVSIPRMNAAAERAKSDMELVERVQRLQADLTPRAQAMLAPSKDSRAEMEKRVMEMREFDAKIRRVTPDSTPPFDSGIEQARRRVSEESARRMKEFEAKLASAKEQAVPANILESQAALERLKFSRRPKIDLDTNAVLSNATPRMIENSKAVQKRIDGRLLNPKPNAPEGLDEQLARARPRAEAEMMSVFKRLNKTPEGDVLEGKNLRQSISWDRWYANIAGLSEPKLREAMISYGNPSGHNEVSITVSADHKLTASVLKSGGNSDFDDATLEAYSALSGDPALAFPSGSRREEVTFTVENSRADAGAVTGINSKPYVGDVEILHQYPAGSTKP